MMVRSVVMRLRRGLGPGLADRIHVHAPGYLIQVSEAELDTLQFEAFCRQADLAGRAGRWDEAARAAAAALALWRGEPLLDMSAGALREEVTPRFEQLRLQALEDGARAELQLGGHEHLIPRLRDLTAQHPLREPFHVQLMMALARAGRRSEALSAYQHARRVLRDELGIDPGPELRRLHEGVLAGDPDLLTPAPARPQSSQPPPSQPLSPSPPRPEGIPWPVGAREVPRQLPAGPRHFVGRASELKALSELQVRHAPAGGPVVIVAISGTAGIGKTALAVHWARGHTEFFADGQLYVNLRGFDPSGTPMPPDDALRGFLSALELSPEHIPADLDERAALYRTKLADRRMLIVLDNAQDVAQVRPLLPGAAGCLVLVTSRDQLAELVALRDAIPLTLDLLGDGEARELLTRRLGAERLAGQEPAVNGLIQTCARLPLALNIAAAHATIHPELPLTTLSEELLDSRRRLDTLRIGDGAADVRAVFSWSYRALAPDTARVFRLLGLHPGPDISRAAAASLAALEPEHTVRALQILTRAHLLTEHAPGRYGFHDLLRAYAIDQALIHDTDAERRDALRRVCAFYTHAAHTADRLLHPRRPPLLLDPPAPGTHPQLLPDMPAALAWFEAEHPNLLAAQQAAAAHRWHDVVWQLAWTLSTFHVRQGHRHEELTAWQAALAAAEHLPDPITRVRAYRLVGRAHSELGGHPEAIAHLNQALELAERYDDPCEQAHTHRTLALVWERRGEARRALEHAIRARELYRTARQPIWEAGSLNQAGLYAGRLGEYDTARAHCRAALAVYRQHPDPTGVAEAFLSLGYVEYRTGHHLEAVEHYNEALSLFRTIGNAYQTADSLAALGHPHAALGQREQARAFWRQALEIFQQQGRTQDADSIQRALDALDALGVGGDG
jgi:tetratricopeptide (TPR) repeat protein